MNKITVDMDTCKLGEIRHWDGSTEFVYFDDSNIYFDDGTYRERDFSDDDIREIKVA